MKLSTHSILIEKFLLLDRFRSLGHYQKITEIKGDISLEPNNNPWEQPCSYYIQPIFFLIFVHSFKPQEGWIFINSDYQGRKLNLCTTRVCLLIAHKICLIFEVYSNEHICTRNSSRLNYYIVFQSRWVRVAMGPNLFRKLSCLK